MNKILKPVTAIITIIASITAIIGLYIQMSTNNPKIDIKTITSDKLTDLPAIDGLKASFTYKDSIVNSLWKLNYFIINSGEELIIGKGNKKNIIDNNLTFALPENYKILEISYSSESFPFIINYKLNSFSIDFLQWKPDEGFEITIYTEQLGVNTTPSLRTNEREIIDGEVNYSTLQNIIIVKKPIFEYLPTFFQTLIWWLTIIVFGLVLIIIPIVWISELIKAVKYKKWYKTDHWMYEEWIDNLIIEKKLINYLSPRKLPVHLWLNYPYIKPTYSDNEFGTVSLGFIMLIIFSLMPLLLLIRI